MVFEDRPIQRWAECQSAWSKTGEKTGRFHGVPGLACSLLQEHVFFGTHNVYVQHHQWHPTGVVDPTNSHGAAQGRLETSARTRRRFWFLETVARMPYFAYSSVRNTQKKTNNTSTTKRVFSGFTVGREALGNGRGCFWLSRSSRRAERDVF